MLSCGIKCYHVGWKLSCGINVIIWGSNVIMRDECCLVGSNVIMWELNVIIRDQCYHVWVECYHVGSTLSCGVKCYHVGLNFVLLDELL
jgi:hypothetical protein